jgi:hypothetical protein
MTEQEVYDSMKAEWMAVLLQLWEAYGKVPDRKQFKVYVTQLGHLSIGQLESGIAHLLTHHKYNSVPTIAEVVDAVDAAANRQDWRDINGFYQVHTTPFRDQAKLARVEHTPQAYRKSWKQAVTA